MTNRKECIAMLLAGGTGSRLYSLTENIAKPAIPYGGKYRIIDFTLSNCTNSGIDTVGVLTQYQPLVLNEYIGNGKPWDLDRNNGGITLLPPYIKRKTSDWYKGTANAIYQNINFIERYSPEYVLILSGDHIYKMDYSKMLEFHKQKGADCTIGVIEVPYEDAQRFGITECDGNGKIIGFEEKPEFPKNNKASMGVYIFNTDKLIKYLNDDEKNKSSSNDFGKNIIPLMLRNNGNIYAYRFSGYWKDVGTISSLWEANMDILGDNPKLNLFDSEWKIFSRTNPTPPQFIAKSANVSNSVIGQGCEIYGTVENSVLFENVYVAPNSVIRDSVILDDVVIEKNAMVNYSIIDRKTRIGNKVAIGEPIGENVELTVIASDLVLSANENLRRNIV
ncbi:MAG: glucose-1-phosphate adenylyltransferase [Clostridia bacterium]|nr:glucose-1-phosphate adenylyltransferase [Clostridia bacterium]